MREFFLSNNSISIDYILNGLDDLLLLNNSESIVMYKFWDTFDNRLFENQLFLQQKEDIFTLKLFSDSQKITQEKLTEKYKLLVSDFQNIILKNKLEPIIQNRALINIFSKEIKRNILILNGKNEKTEIKIKLYYVCDNKVFLKFDFEKEQEKYIKKIIKNLNYYNCKKVNFPFHKYLYDLIDFNSKKYTSKFDISLKKDANIPSSIELIFKYLTLFLTKNTNGIVDDVDIEFLHDFRVALRRIRILLNEIKDKIPESIYENVKNSFYLIQQKTNKLRDYDVFLLHKDYLKNNLPEVLRNGLDYVIREVKILRAKEFIIVRDFILSQDFKNILTNWSNFILNIDQGVSEKKILDFALNSIYLRYQNIIKKGKKINSETPDTELHQLRIECKKLRYLLEFLISILPENESKKLILQIRTFQVFLGKFNDFSVQQEFVYRIITEVELAENEKIEFMTAVGGLINYLHFQKIEIRKNFDIEFAKFLSHTPQFIIPKK